jgi:hypothetical protein
MTQRKIFALTNSSRIVSTVTDQLEWGYDNPVIVAWNAYSRETKGTALSLDGDLDQYKETEEEASNTITYSANFWGNSKQQAAGLGTRPLGYFKYITEDVIGDDGLTTEEEVRVWTTDFEVDLKHPQSQQVMEGPMQKNDKILRVIELDIIRNFTRAV